MGRMRDPQTNGIAINAAPARHVRARTVAAFAPNVFRFNQAVGSKYERVGMDDGGSGMA